MFALLQGVYELIIFHGFFLSGSTTYTHVREISCSPEHFSGAIVVPGSGYV